MAPTFKLEKVSEGLGLNVNSGWIVHHMEYTAGGIAQHTVGTNSQYITTSQSLDPSSFVPLFTMPSETYDKLRTWYGKGTSAISTDNWYAPYQNGGTDSNLALMRQRYGDVVAFVSTTAPTNSATGDWSDATPPTYDARVVRYFPAMIAQQEHAHGKLVVDKYNLAVLAYNSIRETWENYVVILKKEQKLNELE